MSVDTHLIHRCTIRRAEMQDRDGYGNRQRDYTDAVAVDQPCRLVIRDQRQFVSDLVQFLVVTNYILLLPSGVDVQEGDRISDLIYEDGTPVAETFTVRSILHRRGRVVRHVTLKLERVS